MNFPIHTAERYNGGDGSHQPDDDQMERQAIHCNIGINDHSSVAAQADEFLGLFSTTLHSLVADAHAIREITDIADLAGVLPPSDTESEEKTKVVQDLNQLDQLITGVEKKVFALRQIINEENSALTKFETTLKEEAQEQAALIEGLMAAIDLQQGIQEEEEDKEWRSKNDSQSSGDRLHNSGEWRNDEYENSCNRVALSSIRTSNTRSRPVLQSRSNRLETLQRHSSPHPSKASDERHNRKPNSNNQRSTKIVGYQTREEYSCNHRDYDDENDEGQSEVDEEHPSFVPVTKAELKGQIRFGPHLFLYDINEALEEIQEIVREKTLSEHNSSSSSGGWGRNSNQHQGSRSSSSLQRRFDYLRQRQSHGSSFESETEAHAGHLWVSEQELRENCAFFKHGESTARATLQLLCSLRRLKQVPGKNTEVTYLCLF